MNQLQDHRNGLGARSTHLSNLLTVNEQTHRPGLLYHHLSITSRECSLLVPFERNVEIQHNANRETKPISAIVCH